MNPQMVPELRPSGIFRAVKARRERNELATVLLAAFAATLAGAALYVVFG
jgi:hypothetical protein